MSRQTEKLYLEFGSGQFRAGVSWKGSDGGACVNLFSVPSAGMRRGDVADLGAATDALERLLTQLDTQGFSGFQTCELVLPGSLTQSFIVNSRLRLGGIAISSKHGQALRDDLMARVSDPSLEVIDVSIQSWICEGFQGSDLPEGRNSPWLEAVGFSTVIDRHTLARAVAICNASGLTVSATHSSLAAAAQLMLRLSPDASNRIVIDLGHSFTCGMVLVGQRPNAAFMIKAGAHHVTRDIAAALGCSLNTAELLKQEQGLRPTSVRFSNLLEAPTGNQPGSLCNDSLESDDSLKMASQEVYPWAAPRVAEILSLCLRHFAIYAKALDGGITFIGGGSQIQDLSLFVSGKLSGIKATRFKPSLKSLSAALNVTVDHHAGVSVSGFEGLIEVACETARRDLSKSPLFVRGTPTFLRPLMSWFAAISN